MSQDNTGYVISDHSLADLIREQATAMNMSAANAYDAGLQEGFRRAVAMAAILVDDYARNDFFTDHAAVLHPIVRDIRALKLKP